MVTLLFLSFLFPILSISSVKSAATRIIKITDYVTGLNSTTLGNATRQLPSGGIPFTLNVSLSGLTSDLASWQVGITFDNNSLRCTNISVPKTDPSYVFWGKQEISTVDFSNDTQDAKYGGRPQIVAAAALLDPSEAVTVDNALLCVINFTAFRVVEKSEKVISLLLSGPSSYTYLWDSNGVDIPFAGENFLVNLLEGTIVPDNYPTIQAAINSVNSGDSILVRRGTYYENVIANKTVALVGEDRDHTIIDASGAGYVVGIRGANNVSVCNFTIQNGQTGVYAGDWGVGVESSRGNIIHNLVKGNSENGIYVSQTNYCVSDNDVRSNGVGISICSQGAVNGIVKGNGIKNNSKYNLELNSTAYDQLYMDTTNLVDGKPVYCWVRHINETVPANAGQVTLVNCSDILVQDLDLMKNSVNVQFVKSVNCTLQKTNSSSADIGVLLVDSKYCKVNNNTLVDCRINLQVLGSVNNTLTENYFRINGFCGVDFDDSANNSFYHNTMNNLGAAYMVYRAGHNIWDNGYPSGGNYWSDYADVDLKSGPDQNLNGSDEIGDIPYVIDANNSDHYPLVEKQSSTPIHNIDTGLDYATIQAAIDAPETLNGHTIRVEAGTYYEHLTVKKSVSLVGEDSRNTAIDGSSTRTVVNITANNVNLTGFTIRNSGSGYQSSGVLMSSSGNVISHNRIEHNNGSGIHLLSSSYGNNINGNDVLNNTGTGIYILSNDNTLTGNNIVSNSYYGVSLYSSNNNSLNGNSIVANGAYGISLHSSCNNTLINNNISDNDDGIFMWFFSNNNTLTQNKIVGNHFHGVWLDYSSSNSLEGNHIAANGAGFWLQYYSSSNSLIGNNITDNQNCGLGLDTSANNKIYHNNFVNSANVVGTQGLINTWDNGYPSGGNYWSDFNANDLFRGPYKNETGSDGVTDTVHIIDQNNSDLFPLTKPYAGSCDIGTVLIETSEHSVGHLHLWVSSKVINYGEQTETFNISLEANSTKILTQTITLTIRNSTIILFVWNTTRVARGNYSITVIADALQGETDTTDNSLTLEGSVFVTAPGDIAGPAGHPDGIVDMTDVTALVVIFNVRVGGSSWNPDMDVNDDGIINMHDIAIAVFNYDMPQH